MLFLRMSSRWGYQFLFNVFHFIVKDIIEFRNSFELILKLLRDTIHK